MIRSRSLERMQLCKTTKHTVITSLFYRNRQIGRNTLELRSEGVHVRLYGKVFPSATSLHFMQSDLTKIAPDKNGTAKTKVSCNDRHLSEYKLKLCTI